MLRIPSVLLAVVLATGAIAAPAMADCPPVKAKPHKVKVFKKARTKVVACNCVVAKKKVSHRGHVSPPNPPALPPVDHAPYVDTGAGQVDDRPSRVVNLNVEGWETATYTSRRIVERHIVTYSSDGAAHRHRPKYCPDPRHSRRY